MIDPKRDAQALKQLPLDLEIEEVDAEKTFISPDEAQRISEMARATFESLHRGDETQPGVEWFGDYQRLREAGWPWRVAVYIAWASGPKKNRRPRTQDELATRYLGLTSDRQIGKWRAKNPVIDETIGMLQAAPLLAHRRDIYDALVESAMNPDYKGHQDRKLALELLGDYVPRSMLKVSGKLSGKGLEEKSDEELRGLAGEDLTPGPSPKSAGAADFREGEADDAEPGQEEEGW